MSSYLAAFTGSRDLLLTWTMRDFRVRYSQSLLGAAWSILQPLSLMIVFTVVFSTLMQVPTSGIPYPVFVYTALLPWTFFANSLTLSIPSLVTNMALVSKIYFPREILPLSAILVGLVDFAIASSIYVALLLYYDVSVGVMALLVPVVLLVQVLFTFAIALGASAVNVFYRDIRFVIPLVIQIWLYLTPVIYPVDMVPERYQPIYFLNPMAVFVDTYRRLLLFDQMPQWQYLGFAVALSSILMCISFRYFRSAERQFADRI